MMIRSVRGHDDVRIRIRSRHRLNVLIECWFSVFCIKGNFRDISIAWNVPSELAACYSLWSRLDRTTNTSLIGYWSIMELLWTSHLFAVFSATSLCTCRHMNIWQATGIRWKKCKNLPARENALKCDVAGAVQDDSDWMAWLETAIGPLASARGAIAIALREKSQMKGLLGDLHRRGQHSAMRRSDTYLIFVTNATNIFV